MSIVVNWFIISSIHFYLHATFTPLVLSYISGKYAKNPLMIRSRFGLWSGSDNTDPDYFDWQHNIVIASSLIKIVEVHNERVSGSILIFIGQKPMRWYALTVQRVEYSPVRGGMKMKSSILAYCNERVDFPAIHTSASPYHRRSKLRQSDLQAWAKFTFFSMLFDRTT